MSVPLDLGTWEPGIGAEIMGRGKFGPHHGPWPDQKWNGWWGDNPPFHAPVFILNSPSPARRPDEPRYHVHFLDVSPAQALVQARQATTSGDVRIGGGRPMT